MANKRIFYACQAVELAPVDKDGSVGTYVAPKGIQSVGITTNFNLEKIFQLGQLSLYENIENNPEVEVTLNKVFDGTKPLFLLCMGGEDNATSGSLVEFANNRVNLKLGIYPDTDVRASGSSVATLTCTGMYLSSVNFTFPTDGNATEEVTLIGNNKTWASGGLSATLDDDYRAPAIVRRWKFNKAASVFPTGDGGMRSTVLSNVTVSTDLGREAIYTLGQYDPYYRYINFPVDVNTEIESIATDGDFINMDEVAYSCTSSSGNSLKDFPIRLVLCGSGQNDSFTLDLGNKNKIQSINYTGGDTGGGNVTLSYSFQNSSELTVAVEGSYADVVAPTG